MNTNTEKSEEFETAVVKQIKAEIAAAGLNTKSLAEKLNKDYFTLRRYLTGERKMPLGVFLAIAQALDIDAATLVQRAEQRLKT
jgi:ribosome-binding protein aMBF1 (putative translation factor)